MAFPNRSGGGGGGGATNLTVGSRTASTLTVFSDTGNDAVLPAATITLAGLLEATDKVKINDISTTISTAISSQKGSANGIAPLDGSGKVSSSFLPSYVDDVLEFTNLAGFPAVGESGKIYIDLTTDTNYRWTGSVYRQVGGLNSITSASVTDFVEAVQDVVGTTIQAGSGVTVTYSDVTNTFTISSTGGGGSSDYAAVAFSNLIDLSSNFVYAATTVSGPLAFATTGTPKEGAEVLLLLTANGVNFPDFTAFTEVGNSSGYMNVANQVNLIVFTYVAGSYLVSITQIGRATVDTVDPVLSTGTIFRDNPNRIDLLHSEDLLQLPVLLPASFTLTGAGSAGLTVTAATYIGTRGVRLTLSGNAPNAGVINVTYTKPASGSGNEIKDLAGRVLQTYGPTAVANNSEFGIALQYPNFTTVGGQLVEVVTPGASSTYTVSAGWTSGSQTITQSDVFIPAGTDGFIRAKVGKAFLHFGIGANATATLTNFNAVGQVLSVGAAIGIAITSSTMWKAGAGTSPSETLLYAVQENDLIEFRRINSSTTPEIQLRASHNNGNTWELIHRVTADTNIAAALYPYLYTPTTALANLVLTDYIVRG